MNSSDPPPKWGIPDLQLKTFTAQRGQRTPVLSLQNGVQITVKLDCTLAYRVNSTQRTQHIFLGNPQYSMPMRFQKLECRDFLIININIS